MKAHTLETQSAISPNKAIELLQEGNARFVKNKEVSRDL